jgi:hypothetical protein
VLALISGDLFDPKATFNLASSSRSNRGSRRSRRTQDSMPRLPGSDCPKYYLARNYGNVDAQMSLELRAPGSDAEQDDLLAFLKTLTDGALIAAPSL